MKNILKFRSDRRFKIVQFTDIHWHNGEPPDQQSADLMVQVAKAESPDLVVLTGDILSGGGCNDAADSLREVVKIVEGCGAPWAAVFGNHDDEGNANPRRIDGSHARRHVISRGTRTDRDTRCWKLRSTHPKF